MKKKKRDHNLKRDLIILFLLIVALISINYNTIDNFLERFLKNSEEIYVDRVIDGDTIESNGTSIRLLGINSPERGELLYEEATEFLESIILKKNVTLEFTKERYDKYGRKLAYLYINSTNVNVELVTQGFANYYFYTGRDKISVSSPNPFAFPALK
jgi:endonuclease YncB( thermonuclease family)